MASGSSSSSSSFTRSESSVKAFKWGASKRVEEWKDYNEAKDIKKCLKSIYIDRKLPNLMMKRPPGLLCSWYVDIHDALFGSDKPPPESKSKPPPESKSKEEVTRLVVKAIQRSFNIDIEKFLKLHKLPLPWFVNDSILFPRTLWGDGQKFQLNIVNAMDIDDGDGFSALVEVKDFSMVPENVLQAYQKYVSETKRPKLNATEILQQRKIFEKMNFWIDYNKETRRVFLARRYNIRLRGVDAPEMPPHDDPDKGQPYAIEARGELRNIIVGKTLVAYVHGVDVYGRCVADVYCEDVLVQDTLLRKGAVWQHVIYDQSTRFQKLEEQARNSRIGLWAVLNFPSLQQPEAPWDFKWRMKRLEEERKREMEERLREQSIGGQGMRGQMGGRGRGGRESGGRAVGGRERGGRAMGGRERAMGGRERGGRAMGGRERGGRGQ